MSGAAMAQFLNQEGIKFRNLKTFLTDHAAVLKAHAQAMAEESGRPYIYLAAAGTRKEQRAQEIAQADGIEAGLVCVFAQVEPCKTFSFRFQQGPVRSSTVRNVSACIVTTTSWIENLA
jgi:hypothetical protein